jgi:hypothetical protein
LKTEPAFIVEQLSSTACGITSVFTISFRVENRANVFGMAKIWALAPPTSQANNLDLQTSQGWQAATQAANS